MAQAGLPEKIPLPYLHPIVAQDIVGSRDMKIEVWLNPFQQVRQSFQFIFCIVYGHHDVAPLTSV